MIAVALLSLLAAQDIDAIIAADLKSGKRVSVVVGVWQEGRGRVRGDGDAIFEIGSITKTFTGALLAESVRRGEVKLDDPVRKFLPESVKVPSRDGKEITLLDLATHTSGLPRLPSNLFATTKDRANPYADYAVKDLYAFLGGHTLGRDIGAKYEYSNLGVGLLGHALALKAGKSYEALVTERICGPLGMKETGIALSEAQRARLAPGHTADGKRVANWDIPTISGAGALRSSLKDMLKYLEANLGATFEDSHAPRAKTGSGGREVGLGWHLSPLGASRMIWHNGGTGGYASFLGFVKERGVGVVILSNTNHTVDDLGVAILKKLLE